MDEVPTTPANEGSLQPKQTPEETAELRKRKEGIDASLEKDIVFEKRLGRLNYWLLNAFVAISLGSTVAAALGGLFFDWDKKLIGGLAAVPALLAFTATQLKFRYKSEWHYRKSLALANILSRLRLQTSLLPMQDEIKGLDEERWDINKALEDEWNRNHFPDLDEISRRASEIAKQN